jgi:hypothetical protein
MYVDLDDRVLHYVLVGVGLVVGSVIKKGLEIFADSFWNTERKAFKKWKKQQALLKDSEQ